MKLNVNCKQWNDWTSQLNGAIKPFVSISKVFQKSYMAKNELFTTVDSILQFNSPDSHDIDLKSYSVEYLDFLDENNQLHCRKVLKNALEPFDVKPLLFESCNMCFNNVQKGKANYNKKMKTILYCPKCGKPYTSTSMFTRLELGLKRKRPKYFGDGSPENLNARILHGEIVKLFPTFFEGLKTDAKISEELLNTLNKEIMTILSQKLDFSVNKLCIACLLYTSPSPRDS